MSVHFDDGMVEDTFLLNGTEEPLFLPRLSAVLDLFVGSDRARASVQSECNFPVAAGLASSASSFAALALAATKAAGNDPDLATLSNLAGAASGSAARSLHGGYVELSNQDQAVDVRSLLPASDWPLNIVVAVTTRERKSIGSTEAMEVSRKTSPFYQRWIEDQQSDLEVARTAIAHRDFAALGEIAEHNCLKMHSVMWSSRPPIVYWNQTTLNCLATLRELQASGVDVFFTIDAGPQVKAICTQAAVREVSAALAETDGVIELLHSGLGEGARLESDRD
jgi:diphosphomevalonate decarboxylase